MTHSVLAKFNMDWKEPKLLILFSSSNCLNCIWHLLTFFRCMLSFLVLTVEGHRRMVALITFPGSTSLFYGNVIIAES